MAEAKRRRKEDGSIKCKGGEMRCTGRNGRDETVISRLTFGHTGLKYIIQNRKS